MQKFDDSTEVRFNRAVEAARAKGIAVIHDESFCCSSCGVYEIELRYPTTPVAYLTNSQTRDLWWYQNEPCFLEEGSRERGEIEGRKLADHIFFHFNDTKAAAAISIAFAAEGFDVNWEGDGSSSVEIVFNESMYEGNPVPITVAGPGEPEPEERSEKEMAQDALSSLPYQFSRKRVVSWNIPK